MSKTITSPFDFATDKVDLDQLERSKTAVLALGTSVSKSVSCQLNSAFEVIGRCCNDSDVFMDKAKNEHYGVSIILSEFANLCHFNAWKNGWWSDLATGAPQERNVFEVIALIHSEVSESFDADCFDYMDDHLPKRLGSEVELGDALIRLLECMPAMGVNIGDAIYDRVLSGYTCEEFVDAAHQHSVIHSKISALTEAFRKSNDPEFAIADIVIEISRLIIYKKFNVGDALLEKLHYNNSRLDHKVANRAAGGKIA